MALISVYKVVSSLPSSLDSNALYLVRTGTGFDFYVSDSTGSVAYQINPSSAKLSNIVEDTTPQLGGDLDLNDNDITGTGNISITGEIEADIHIGSLRGEIQFKAKAGEALTKGDPVYISNYDTVGNTPIVAIAEANDSAKMPCFGLANESVSLNASVNVVTFGTLSGLDTSSFGLGDTLYISSTGTLTNSKPAGESSLIQNIGKVQRVDNSAGSIKVGGSGRTNDVPNLNQGNVFIGNASNQVEKRGLTLDDIAETPTNKHFTSGDESKLNGIESGATADQTDSEIKTAYENNPNTNAFTDAEQTKLSAIESNADVTDTANVTASGALMDSEVANLAAVKTFDPSDYATATQGATADAALPKTGGTLTGDLFGTNTTLSGYLRGPSTFYIDPAVHDDDTGTLVIRGNLTVQGTTATVNSETVTISDNIFVLNSNATGAATEDAGVEIERGSDANVRFIWDEINDRWYTGGQDLSVASIVATGTVDGRDVAADGTKLDGIEANATADQTGAEIKTAYEAEANTNAFTDAEKSKLSGIETGATADQTAGEILTAIKTVDGDGSGLDADTLDGLHGSAFVQSNTNATFSGLTISTSSTPSSRTATGTQGQLAYDEYFSYVCTSTDRWRRAALFEPQYIPAAILSNLVLWHEMADAWEVGLAGSEVDNVKDLSGNDFSATQSTFANRPSFSSKVVEFNGSSDYLELSSDAVTDLQSTSQTTTFIVCESSDTSLGTIFGISDTTQGSREHIIRQPGNGSVELMTRGGTSGLTSLQISIPTTNKRMLIIYRANGTNTLLSARGGGVTNNNSYSSSSVSWDSCVGANTCKYGINEDSGGVQWPYEGKIYEGMIFKTGLSDTMMETVAEYFKNKYDIDW